MKLEEYVEKNVKYNNTFDIFSDHSRFTATIWIPFPIVKREIKIDKKIPKGYETTYKNSIENYTKRGKIHYQKIKCGESYLCSPEVILYSKMDANRSIIREVKECLKNKKVEINLTACKYDSDGNEINEIIIGKEIWYLAPEYFEKGLELI